MHISKIKKKKKQRKNSHMSFLPTATANAAVKLFGSDLKVRMR